MDSSLWTFSIDKLFPLGRFNYVFQECLITLNSLEMSEEKIPITTISLGKKKKQNFLMSPFSAIKIGLQGDSTNITELS